MRFRDVQKPRYSLGKQIFPEAVEIEPKYLINLVVYCSLLKSFSQKGYGKLFKTMVFINVPQCGLRISSTLIKRNENWYYEFWEQHAAMPYKHCRLFIILESRSPKGDKHSLGTNVFINILTPEFAEKWSPTSVCTRHRLAGPPVTPNRASHVLFIFVRYVFCWYKETPTLQHSDSPARWPPCVKAWNPYLKPLVL